MRLSWSSHASSELAVMHWARLSLSPFTALASNDGFCPVARVSTARPKAWTSFTLMRDTSPCSPSTPINETSKGLAVLGSPYHRW
jgi:hypothetical protein